MNELEQVAAEIEALAAATLERATLERQVVEAIARLDKYDWVGFYWLDASDPRWLELGAFVGASTEHVRIPVERGICGAAVAEAQTIVVDDVTSDPRYLACSIETRSEIVVPVYAEGRIVGEIDIDSHTASAFGGADRIFVERCARAVGEYLARTGA